MPAFAVTVLFALLLCRSVAPKKPVGINLDPTNADGSPSADAIAATGASWIRIEFKANAGSSFDSAVRFYREALRRHTTKVLMIIDYSSVPGAPWGGTPEQWLSYSETFASVAARLAQNFTGLVSAYEIWNEPDLNATHVPATSYGVLLQHAYTSIKANVRHPTDVVFGGLASGNPQFVANAMAGNGGVLACDQVGLHPYGQRPFPDWPSPTWGFGTVAALVANYVAVVGNNVPIFITEVGTNDLQVQGSFPWMIFDSTSQLEAVSVTLWFCWSDGMVSPFGLLTAGLKEKAAYHSFVNYTLG